MRFEENLKEMRNKEDAARKEFEEKLRKKDEFEEMNNDSEQYNTQTRAELLESMKKYKAQLERLREDADHRLKSLSRTARQQHEEDEKRLIKQKEVYDKLKSEFKFIRERDEIRLEQCRAEAIKHEAEAKRMRINTTREVESVERSCQSKIRDAVNSALESQTREAKEMIERLRRKGDVDKAKMMTAQLRNTLNDTIEIVHEISSSRPPSNDPPQDTAALLQLLEKVEHKNKLISSRYGSLVNEVKRLREENMRLSSSKTSTTRTSFVVQQSDDSDDGKKEIGHDGSLANVLRLVENLENERDHLKNQVQALVSDSNHDDEEFATPPTSIQQPAFNTTWSNKNRDIQNVLEKHSALFLKQYEFAALSLGISVSKVRFKGQALQDVASSGWLKFLMDVRNQRLISNEMSSKSENNLERAISAIFDNNSTLRAEDGLDWEEMKLLFEREARLLF